jgi:hypothetical protein
MNDSNIHHCSLMPLSAHLFRNTDVTALHPLINTKSSFTPFNV